MSEHTLSQRVAEEVRVTLARRRLSASELARRMGVTQPYISRRLTGDITIDVNDLDKIARALDVEVTALLPTPSRAAGRSASEDTQYSHPGPTVPTGQTPRITARPAGGRPPTRSDSTSPSNLVRRPVRLSRRGGDGAE